MHVITIAEYLAYSVQHKLSSINASFWYHLLVVILNEKSSFESLVYAPRTATVTISLLVPPALDSPLIQSVLSRLFPALF